MGGRINWNYNLLIHTLELGLGAKLGNHTELVYISFVPQ